MDAPQDLIERTQSFAIRTLSTCRKIRGDSATRILLRQLVRAATSVGANYRGARRARSKKEFVSKLGIVEEEADECVYWLELLDSLRKDQKARLVPLRQEAEELLRIIVPCKKTARKSEVRSAKFEGRK